MLEPWITPSLFYQFQNRDIGETAVDMYGTRAKLRYPTVCPRARHSCMQIHVLRRPWPDRS